jgi:hypothetical protein
MAATSSSAAVATPAELNSQGAEAKVYMGRLLGKDVVVKER